MNFSKAGENMTTSQKDQSFNINMQEWMQSAMNLWKKWQTPNTVIHHSRHPNHHLPVQKNGSIFMSSMNMIQLAFAGLFEPDNIESTFQKSDAISSASIDIMQKITDSIMEMQTQWIERCVRIGKETKAYSFDDMDKEIFTTWKNIYEKEFQHLFQIPTIGLFRYYQERVNNAMDKFNVFNEAMTEFMYMLYVPFEKTTQVFQKELENKMAKGEFSNNVKEHYNQWLRILEGHFMSLLKSKEYTDVLNHTIRSYVQYKKAKEDVMIDLLQQIPVPTNKEMDELYKEIYELKQTIKSLKKTVQSLTSNY
ncbi:MAG: PhaE [Candidatus Magnetoglobus multicellularis str. Araruama]|uniref:Poly(3-hydroxyalkanoate) polymerase subunit PhaE n=1 Tax=Candidatus Magnetoglobus multicellularis str. Araruama TaxID=890399 RepID=A0A1V1PIZ3_9BACT|nr:MAG: PhaE [Candidatus Magnetoglobus multicellularis str. Araruama]